MNDIAQPLKLMALDEEDLAILSVHLQDAILKVSDIAYEKKEKFFALVANRFVWEKQKQDIHKKEKKQEHERRQTGFQIRKVNNVRLKKIDLKKPETILSLLAMTFTPKEAPEGVITLHFANGAAIKIEVECIEAAMKDLGSAWQTEHKPHHTLEETSP